MAKEVQYFPTNTGSGDTAKFPCPMMEPTDHKPEGKLPPYFPQPGDEIPVKPQESMKPIGPWATGRVNYTPKDGLTGVRPVVNEYSITRFGPGQWRGHNYAFFEQSNEKIKNSQLAISNAMDCVQRSYKEADRAQLDSTEHLKGRGKLLYHWKSELEHAIIEITDELDSLETERRRVKQSLSVLTIPESIAGEFLRLRSRRLESDLIRDDVEEELTKEVALCSEIRELLGATRDQIETQLTDLKAAKARLEVDWTDKSHAYETDSQCIKLKTDSPVIMWKPGSTRLPADQSTPAGYENYTREVLTDAETARQRSINLRSTLDSIYKTNIKDLRDQASRVDLVLSEKIKITEEVCQHLEKELLRCLYELANTEKAIEQLRHSTRGLDNAMKLAQTRLANRLQRRNVESCRDNPQYALVEEVKLLNERTSAMLSELRHAEETQAGLVKARSDLEREIIVKRKTLYIDKERGQLLRSFYPSTGALSGF